MNLRTFTVLFAVILLLGTAPVFFVEPSGTASAGLASGFAIPMENIYHVFALVTIGLLAAWLGREAMLVLPLAAMLMLAIGAMMQIDDHQFTAVRMFIVGSIILFSLSVSLLRHKAFLLSIPPIALWAYFAGNSYIANVPTITTPLYFLMGMVINASLMLAIGVTLGMTINENINASMERLKNFPAVSSFLSFF